MVKKYEVLSLSYSFHQHVNPNTNETTSEVFGGNIDVSIETRNADAKIIELMVLTAQRRHQRKHRVEKPEGRRTANHQVRSLGHH
jgi:hypothetical protein